MNLSLSSVLSKMIIISMMMMALMTTIIILINNLHVIFLSLLAFYSCNVLWVKFRVVDRIFFLFYFMVVDVLASIP